MKAKLSSMILLLAMSCPAYGQKPHKTSATRTPMVKFAQVKAEKTPQGTINKAKALKLKVDRLVANVDRDKFVGMAVGVITGNDRYQLYYGETVLGNQKPPSHDTLFAIGSVTKTFTATLLALYNHRGLVRIPPAPLEPLKFRNLEVGPVWPQHLVNIETTLRDLLPTQYGLATQSHNITLEQLADHHSGLPRKQGACATGRLNGDVDCLLKQLATCVPNAAPKKNCHAPTPLSVEGDYSNYAYAVLSHLLARFRGLNVTWSQALSDEILRPMGMYSTNERAAFLDSACYTGSCGYANYGECTFKSECNATFSKHAAVGYIVEGYNDDDDDDEERQDGGPNNQAKQTRSLDQGSDEAAAGGAGALWSTLDDQMIWLGYNMGLKDRRIKRELIDILPELQTPRDGIVGLAWETEKWDGAKVITKRGAVKGFHSVVAFDPSRGIGVVVLVNSALKPSAIAQKILAVL